MIIADSREQKNSHILKYWDRHGVPYVVKKLDTGDYMDSDQMDITIDRKKNLLELSGNLCSRNSARFWREVKRAQDNNLKMIVLIEERNYQSIEDVIRWTSKYSRVTGRQLRDAMVRVHIAYQVEFLFCDSRSSGRRILELLHYDKR